MLEELRRAYQHYTATGSKRRVALEFVPLVLAYVNKKVPGGQGPEGTIGVHRTARDLIPGAMFGENRAEWVRQRENLRRQINKWQDKERRFSVYNNLRAPQRRRLTLHSGPAVANLDIEEELYQWILERRQANMPMTREIVIRRAVAAKPSWFGDRSDDMFVQRANSWYYRFLQRKNLSIRRVSSSGQRLPNDWQLKVNRNLQALHTKMEADGIQVHLYPHGASICFNVLTYNTCESRHRYATLATPITLHSTSTW